MRASQGLTTAFLFAGALALASCTSMSSGSNLVPLTVTLNGASEVPPTSSTGKGDGSFKFDKATKSLSWTINYSGLTGDAAAAHLHGPAAPGANAPVIINLATAGKVENPMVGETALSDSQAADLLAGKWYVNIHTKANPGGEIRGQIAPAS
jgi:hypothetical protein